MSSSKLLKERIESIQDTMKITNAMYLISSSKLRKARQNYQNVSPYFNRMRDKMCIRDSCTPLAKTSLKGCWARRAAAMCLI